MKENNNTPIDTNLHMTADVWNALVDMMNVDQLDNFIETLEFAQDKFISNEVITNAVDDFGGAGQVLLMLNAFRRMENLFKTINQALKAKGGVA